MKKKILALMTCIFVISCGASSKGLEGIYKSVPKDLRSEYKKYFVKYMQIIAPNGKPIYILAQDRISDEKMIRVKNIMEFYLTNYKGSEYGANKDEVRNSMANNEAILLLLNGSDNGENPANDIGGQPLYENEIQIEGGKWYITQDYEHRDASYEEILHLVHDTGIGVIDKGALPEFQKEIQKAQKYALKHKIWGLGEDEWIEELAEEGSLTQEYLASLIDAYYGLWGAWDEDKSKSMWGIYTPRDRKEIKTEDKLGQKLLENKFFHPYFTYNARIDKNFKGTFSLKFDISIPYTYHSRYLKDITLLGNNPINVVGNQLDNFITGNNGINTVVFSGKLNEYKISTKDGITIIKDLKTNRDGTDKLKNIEIIKFSNKIIKL